MRDSPINVLLVASNHDNSIVIQDLLTGLGRDKFNLEWVATYHQGLAAIANHHHDMYLVDSQLGGLDLLQTLTGQGCSAPVIMLTEPGDQNIPMAAMNAGAADYLVKGDINASLLDRSIRYAIQWSHTRSELRRTLEERNQLALAIANVNTGVIITDPKQPGNPVLFVNPAFTAMTGYAPDDVIGKNCRCLQGEGTDPQTLAQIREAIAHHAPISCTLLNYRKDGTPFWNELNIKPVFDAQGQLTNFIGLQTDVTVYKQAEERLLHNALYDVLTNLPNRALLMDRLNHVVHLAKRNQDYLFALLFLDLDRFKVINDSLGHMMGDRLLIAIAQRLSQCLRPGDTVARLGGDEFIILLEGIQDSTDATIVADRIQRELSHPFLLEGHEIFTTASIGIALSTTGYDFAEDLIRDADTAMYRAKSRGWACYEIFNKGMHTRAVAQLQMETDLRRAIDRREFLLHYQPIVCLKSCRIVGFEALLRWRHPDRGMVPPVEFIPMAEETGLIIPIGLWILQEACAQMRRWQLEYPTLSSPLTISVNLSGKQLTPQIVGQIQHILQETHLDHRCLRLEITESVLMENTDSATALLTKIQELGIQLSMDDFGTGYSSLSYLHRFPIDILKIDRSFINKIDQNGEQLAIVRTIMTLAWNLGMDVVAEGLETAMQLAQLRSLRCEYGQGYLFSPPLSSDQAGELLAAEPTWRDILPTLTA